MPERLQNSEFYQFLLKLIVPAFIGVGLRLAVQMRKSNKKISLINIILSLFIGISGAYLASPLINTSCDEKYIPLAIALIAMTSEKIGEYVIYKLNVDLFLTAIVDGFFDYIINLRNKK